MTRLRRRRRGTSIEGADVLSGIDFGSPIIRMRDITKVFRTPAGDFTALAGVDVDFRRGEFVSVVGRSGSGKSTLINMITGIDRPTEGTVSIGDVAIDGLDESRMSRWRGRNLGIVFQFYQLLPMLSLLENVMLPMDFSEMYTPLEREQRANALLRQVGLGDEGHKMPSSVSGGQQQCAAVARALACDPPIVVADEPTGNLDTRAADTIFGIFDDLAERGKTVIMVTHDDGLASRAMRCLRIADGILVSDSASPTAAPAAVGPMTAAAA